ncbi:MAG TPA: TrkA C-terminal domain-containing protein [Anaerovoracaceae bacterium]|nr:TrkA C-terminal domain-containing protein [Anaerovoracaceae bacterium]
MKKISSLPIYMKIAIDMASKISKSEIKIGTKISGRSTLASEYNVSPETIRKANTLLSDMDIVEVKHGKGIYVNSKEQASKFIDNYKNKENIKDLRNRINQIINERESLDQELYDATNTIIEYSVRFKNNEHIPIYQESVPEDSWVIGKCFKELMVWQNTGVTIVAVKRNNSIQISPGPYETFKEKDEILFVGDNSSGFRLKEFLNDEIDYFNDESESLLK